MPLTTVVTVTAWQQHTIHHILFITLMLFIGRHEQHPASKSTSRKNGIADDDMITLAILSDK